MERFIKCVGFMLLMAYYSVASAASPLGKAIKDAKLSKAQIAIIEKAYIDSTIAMLPDTRIVGGEPAKAGELPWAVALVAVDSYGNRKQFCGGTLIAPRKVVTAAHCNVFPIQAVRAVVNRLEIPLSDKGMISIKSFASHPDYEGHIKGSDIAVLTLEEDASGAVAPLAESDPNYAGFVQARIWGWGAIYEGGPSSHVLLKATVPFVDRATCQAAYPDLPEGTVCAGRQAGGVDTCQGDSGGGIMAIGPSESLSLAGVVSYGKGCARQGFFGVYTSVPAHRAWVDQQ